MSIDEKLIQIGMERPEGNLGSFYDRVKTYHADPPGEIERLANAAMSDGIIDGRRYIVLKYRLPFHNIQRETFKTIRKKLGGITGERVRQIEKKAAEVMLNYVKREEGAKIRERSMEEYMNLTLDYLPWGRTPMDARARKALKHLKAYNDGLVTIRDVVLLFEDLAKQDKKLVLRGYRTQCADTTYETFAMAGITLARVKVD